MRDVYAVWVTGSLLLLAHHMENRSNSKDIDMLPIDGLNGLPQVQQTGKSPDALMQAAKDLESAFLAEMLKSAGLGKAPESFGGGAGEEQFASFLRQAQADAMVEAGGIGLAQQLFEALSKGQTDAG